MKVKQPSKKLKSQ